MATQDNSEEEITTTTDDEVETPVTTEEDETTDQDEDDDSNEEDEVDEGDEASEDDDDSDDDDSDEEDEDPEFKKAFSQIKGDTALEYIPNLEEAYRKSSAEGKRLSGEKKELQDRIDQINEAVSKNPELAKVIMEATGEKATAPTVDPGVLKARQDYETDVETKLNSFLSDHKTLADDDGLMEEFMENLAVVGAQARKAGKVLDPAVAYRKAYGMMDVDDSQDKLVTAAKNSAGKPKTPAAKKQPKKSEKGSLTPEQIAYGKRMGLTEKQMLDSQKRK